MTDSGRLAECTVCDARGCYSSHFLVRGTRVEFVSVEGLKRSGARREERDGEVFWDALSLVINIYNTMRRARAA